MKVQTMAELAAEGKSPEILFWVGCAGSFDARAIKVTKAFVKILNAANIEFAILGQEERCTGDPARRAGNEFLFQMSAMMNIETLNQYKFKRIVTTCPHCFNTFKNEYPALGGNFKVVHHSEYLQELISEGKIRITGDGEVKGKKITYHDSCYIGRGNDIYEAPREVLNALGNDIVEMKRCKSDGLCCGAGGAEMFKENEPGDKRINTERAEEALSTGAEIIAANCPFCITMMEDGVKEQDAQDKVTVMDLAEIIASSIESK